MSDDKISEVIMSDQVKEAISKDAGMAEFLRKFSADARQSMEDVKAGRYKTFDDAMNAKGYEGGVVGKGDDIHDENIMEMIDRATFDGESLEITSIRFEEGKKN